MDELLGVFTDGAHQLNAFTVLGLLGAIGEWSVKHDALTELCAEPLPCGIVLVVRIVSRAHNEQHLR